MMDMDDEGAAGSSSNSDGDGDLLPSRSMNVLITSIVFLGVATVFVVMRSVSKFGIRKRADVDDGVIILAWLFTVGLAVTVVISSVNGLGQPDAIIQQHPEWWSSLKATIYVFPIFYQLSTMTAKTAALLLYIRMARAHTFLRYASYAILAVVDITGVVLILLTIFQCRPLSAAWTWDKEGQCFDLVTLFLASSPINILSDLAILYLPLPIITGLRIERKAKIGLVLAFLCGIFVAVVDVVRIAYLQDALKNQIQAGFTHVSASSRPPNYYWTNSWGVMWSVIECSVRVACCCALVLKPFLQKLWPSSFLSSGPNNLSRRSAGRSVGGGKGGSGENGSTSRAPNGQAPNGNANRRDINPEMSIISHKSLKNLPIQALLERDPATAEEDCMDLMEFFSGPPELGVQRAGAFNSAGEPSSPRLGVGHLDGKSHDGKEDQTGTKNESPASTDTMGAPLMTAPTRVSQRGNTWSVLTSPIRWVTNQRAPVDQTQQPTQRFFDVVHMGRRRPLTELTAREAWWPIMFISILFFLWGFSYGLLGNLNSQIMTVIPDSTPSKNIALQNAYWLGYIIGPTTVGAYTLTKHGFKVTFMTGLVIYGCATMCFWPSSVLASYGGFVFCNILVGMGLSVLEVAANPFIALAGPGELSEARLNFSQGIQAVASIVSPILAQKVFFRRVDGRISLFDIQWCYLAVALFVLFLALVFFYVPLSEASDDELETLAVERLDFAGLNLGSRAFSSNISARWFLICGGCAVMMLYCGAQESISYFWNQYITTIASSGSCSPFWDITIAHSLFAASRFIAAGLCYMGMPPRLILNVCLGSTFLTTLLAVVLPDGNGAYACIQLALFFEGPVFPTLFAMALRGQGRRTKQASIALTASIGLAVIWQSSTWAIYQRTHDVRHAFILVAVMCGVQALYSLALNASSVLRRFVDPKWSLHGGDRPAGRQSISQHVVGAETPAMTEKDYHRAPLSMTRSISAHRDEKERFETGIQSQNEKDVKGKEGHLVVVAARSARSSSGDSGSGDSEPPSPNPSTVTTGPGSGPSPPAGHVRRHSAYDYSSAAVPALARVPEEAAGPTDDFAGIGVVGELPDI